MPIRSRPTGQLGPAAFKSLLSSTREDLTAAEAELLEVSWERPGLPL